MKDVFNVKIGKVLTSKNLMFNYQLQLVKFCKSRIIDSRHQYICNVQSHL